MHVELFNNLMNIISSFDFEKFAIDLFDDNAIAESIPYGDPYCLLIDGCIFMILKDGNIYGESDVRKLLKGHGWPDIRISKAIENGYEISSDVWDAMADLPIVYINDDKD